MQSAAHLGSWHKAPQTPNLVYWYMIEWKLKLSIKRKRNKKHLHTLVWSWLTEMPAPLDSLWKLRRTRGDQRWHGWVVHAIHWYRKFFKLSVLNELGEKSFIPTISLDKILVRSSLCKADKTWHRLWFSFKSVKCIDVCCAVQFKARAIKSHVHCV